MIVNDEITLVQQHNHRLLINREIGKKNKEKLIINLLYIIIILLLFIY
jgi:hypothetical protein